MKNLEQKIRQYYNEYLSEYCDTNRKKLYAIRLEIKELNWVVDSNKDEIQKGRNWCWYLGEKYTKFNLQKDIKTIQVLTEMYRELKK